MYGGKKVGFLLYFFCQENARWIKDLNVKMEPLMYLEENKAGYFYTFGMEKHFLNMSTGLFFILVFDLQLFFQCKWHL